MATPAGSNGARIILCSEIRLPDELLGLALGSLLWRLIRAFSDQEDHMFIQHDEPYATFVILGVALTSIMANPNNTCKSFRVAKTHRLSSAVTVVCGGGNELGREVLLHDFVTQSLTFEVSVDACEWQSGVPQLENHVSASEQDGQHAREARHMTRVP
jgi:hypothetical protein